MPHNCKEEEKLELSIPYLGLLALLFSVWDWVISEAISPSELEIRYKLKMNSNNPHFLGIENLYIHMILYLNELAVQYVTIIGILKIVLKLKCNLHVYRTHFKI